MRLRSELERYHKSRSICGNSSSRLWQKIVCTVA
ncbi:unnamed protein product [Haemonchus placei]|uniref:Uncharacterized protein n=1 Tax=Haemonchus placei TaxID=6290 RepID=A0A0N4WR17_HAEPC|nr:unnamed protein product [Haemonchus placei]